MMGVAWSSASEVIRAVNLPREEEDLGVSV